jgi:hypothetical protein
LPASQVAMGGVGIIFSGIVGVKALQQFEFTHVRCRRSLFYVYSARFGYQKANQGREGTSLGTVPGGWGPERVRCRRSSLARRQTWTTLRLHFRRTTTPGWIRNQQTMSTTMGRRKSRLCPLRGSTPCHPTFLKAPRRESNRSVSHLFVICMGFISCPLSIAGAAAGEQGDLMPRSW